MHAECQQGLASEVGGAQPLSTRRPSWGYDPPANSFCLTIVSSTCSRNEPVFFLSLTLIKTEYWDRAGGGGNIRYEW